MKKLILSLFIFCSVFASAQISIPQVTGLPAALNSKVDKVTGKSLVADTLSSKIQPHVTSVSNPHAVTKSQIGLGNVDNTSDLNKPVSIAQKAALDLKQTVFTGICQEQFLTENDIIIDNTALTLTIATVKNGQPISALNPICFYTDGNGTAVKHEKSTPVVFNFTNTDGVWYFYFDSSGNPIATQTSWSDFSTIASVYRFYWNSTLAVSERRVIESIEYHKNDISWADHMWKHAEGTKYLSGFNISHNATVSSTPNINGSNAVVTLSSGSNIDDNMEYSVTHAASGSVKFTQNLGTGLLPATSGKFICISNDASLRLQKIPATDFPFLWNTTTNIPQYLTPTGVRTDVSNGYFFVYYIYALQDPRYGEAIKIKSAETDFASSTLAAAHNWEQLQAIFPTLRDGEIRLLYKLTFEYKSAYDIGTKKAALRVVDDLRKQKTTTTATAGGLLPATSVVVSPIGNIASTNVQSALQELDSEKQPVGTYSTDIHGNITALNAVLGTNTGDETTATIKTKLGITTLSGANTGDQTTVSGNAGTATKLQTSRTINGVAFDGTQNITVNAVDATPRVASSLLGAANGVATLDANGIILTTQLPSYIDDVLEYANLASFPASGETGKIYVAKDTNKTYRWSGSVYVYITSGAVDTVNGYTGVVNLTKTDVGLGNVDNTSDANKPISTATQSALNGKQASGTYSTDIHGNITALNAVSNTNTGDETLTSIKTKLGAASSVSDGYLRYQDFALLHTPTTVTASNGLSISGQNISLQNASLTQSGALTFNDWNTFDSKEPAITKKSGFNLPLGNTTGTVLEGRTFGTAANSAVGDFIQNQNTSTQSANINISGDITNGGNAFFSTPNTYLRGRNAASTSYKAIIGVGGNTSAAPDKIIIDPDNNGSYFGGAATFSSTVNSTGFLLNGNNLTSSLSQNYLPKWNGSTFVNASAGTDYQLPITLTTNGASGAATFENGVMNVPNYGSNATGGSYSPSISAGSNTANPVVYSALYTKNGTVYSSVIKGYIECTGSQGNTCTFNVSTYNGSTANLSIIGVGAQGTNMIIGSGSTGSNVVVSFINPFGSGGIGFTLIVHYTN